MDKYCFEFQESRDLLSSIRYFGYNFSTWLPYLVIIKSLTYSVIFHFKFQLFNRNLRKLNSIKNLRQKNYSKFKNLINQLLLIEIYSKSYFEFVLEVNVNYNRYRMETINICNIVNGFLLIVIIIYTLLVNCSMFKKLKLSYLNYLLVALQIIIYVFPRIILTSLILFQLEIDYVLILVYANLFLYIVINFFEHQLVYNPHSYNKDKAKLSHLYETEFFESKKVSASERILTYFSMTFYSFFGINWIMSIKHLGLLICLSKLVTINFALNVLMHFFEDFFLVFQFHIILKKNILLLEIH